jgi:Na+/H+ antiporter NhaD/arsenite permease-like protein
MEIKLTKVIRLTLLFLALVMPLSVFAGAGTPPEILGIRLEFVIFALTLVGVAVFHHKTMYVALTGLTLLLILKLVSDSSFNLAEHIFGHEPFSHQLSHIHYVGEWSTLLNLVGLLFGFAILAKHFEESKIPEVLPNVLPDDWRGGLVLLFLIMVLSSILDNIAAAMIGGTIALVVFKGKVHLGYLAAIVAASNAGGAGSVVGDTTTTLMWIDGVSPFDVLSAGIAAIGAFCVFGFIAAHQQQKFSPIIKSTTNVKINWGKVGVVVMILAFAILSNYLLEFPAIGVWLALLLGSVFQKTDWRELKNAWQGSIFLVSLVFCASLMPVNDLPEASWQTAFLLGFVSAVFDNIPLTKLCLVQGHYDWGMLAYAVGFGGSMIWFGSSAGVALSNKFPEAKDTVEYIKKGWHVALAYIVGFFLLFGVLGWNSHHYVNKSHNPKACPVCEKQAVNHKPQ